MKYLTSVLVWMIFWWIVSADVLNTDLEPAYDILSPLFIFMAIAVTASFFDHIMLLKRTDKDKVSRSTLFVLSFLVNILFILSIYWLMFLSYTLVENDIGLWILIVWVLLYRPIRYYSYLWMWRKHDLFWTEVSDEKIRSESKKASYYSLWIFVLCFIVLFFALTFLKFFLMWWWLVWFR